MPESLSTNSWVIIPAAGVGSRMQSAQPKQYLQIHNKTILEHALSCFSGVPPFDHVLLGVAGEDHFIHQLDVSRIYPDVLIYQGGSTRAETVLNGLMFIEARASEHDWVWVHDAARPCLSDAEIASIMSNLEGEECGLVLAVPVADTLKRTSGSGDKARIASTVDRANLWRAMTPQVFRYGLLKRALEQCIKQGLAITDESSAIEYMGGQPKLVLGSEQNIKVTLAGDLEKARLYFAHQQGCPARDEN